MIALRAKPNQIRIDLRQTALIVVDMQNAFASKGGMFDLAGFDISGAARGLRSTKRSSVLHGGLASK